MDEFTQWMANKVQGCESFRILSQVWLDIGYSQRNVAERRVAVWEHTEKLFQDMAEEELEMKNTKIKKIEEYLKERHDWCKQLSMAVPSDPEDLSLIEMEKVLKESLQVYHKIRDERNEILNGLLPNEARLVSALGITKRPLIVGVPSIQQLEDFKTYLKEKENDKLRLEEIFETTRESIMSIMQKLGLQPENKFETLVANGLVGFQLSNTNMEQLKELHQSMERRVEETRARVTLLREKLSALWERLKEPNELRCTFVERHVGLTSDTIQALREEIDRCEQKKRENIKNFVENVRVELKDWWNRCHYSKAQQAEFQHFQSDLYCEDLLAMHELAVDRLKQFHNKNRDIFQLFQEFQALWDQMIVLEEKAQQPNRFGNRGGQLLQEEKERKKILKDLPKIEKELKSYLKKYEQENGHQFLSFGKPLVIQLENMWHEHEEQKEREKIARKQRNQTADGLSATKAGISMKRKTPHAEPLNSTKRTKTAERKKATEQTVSVPMKRERENPRRVNRVARNVFNASRSTSVETPHQADLLCARTNVTNAANATTYTDFQEYIKAVPLPTSDHMVTRSSGDQSAIVPQLSKDRNQPSHALGLSAHQHTLNNQVNEASTSHAGCQDTTQTRNNVAGSSNGHSTASTKYPTINEEPSF